MKGWFDRIMDRIMSVLILNDLERKRKLKSIMDNMFRGYEISG